MAVTAAEQSGVRHVPRAGDIIRRIVTPAHIKSFEVSWMHEGGPIAATEVLARERFPTNVNINLLWMSHGRLTQSIRNDLLRNDLDLKVWPDLFVCPSTEVRFFGSMTATAPLDLPADTPILVEFVGVTDDERIAIVCGNFPRSCRMGGPNSSL